MSPPGLNSTALSGSREARVGEDTALGLDWTLHFGMRDAGRFLGVEAQTAVAWQGRSF